MTTTTSFFDKRRFVGLYKSTFRRNAGYLGLLCTLMAIFYPLQYAMEIFKYIRPVDQPPIPGNPFYYYDLNGIGMNFTEVSAVFFTAIVLLAPMVLALLLGSYMQSKKAADVYHALPIRRELLLTVNLAVGMSFIAIPVVGSTVLVAILQTAKFGFWPGLLGMLLLDMLGWLVAAFCIYTITAFVSVLVGTVFDNAVLAGSLLIALPSLCGLFILLCNQYLYGFDASEKIFTTLFNLSPITLMPGRFMFAYSPVSGAISDTAGTFAASNIAIFVWLLLGVLLFCVAARLYRSRNSEMAETTTSKGILQLLIKLEGVILAAACTGFLFQAFNYNNSLPTFYLWATIGGILSYVIIEVVLNRGFKTLARSLPLGALLVAVSLGGFAAITTGGLGFENRVPAAAKVASVEISYMGRFQPNLVKLGAPIPTAATAAEPIHALPNEVTMRSANSRDYDNWQNVRTTTLREEQSVATVLAFHKAVTAENFGDNESALLDMGAIGVYPRIQITYKLRGGGTMSRRYNSMTAGTLALLAPLETTAEFVRQTHGAFFTPPEQVATWAVADPFGVNSITLAYSVEESRALLEAIQTDLLATTAADLPQDKKAPIAVLSYMADFPPEGNQIFTRTAYFYVTSETQQTYKLLQQAGTLSRIGVNPADCYAATMVPFRGRHNSDGSSINHLQPGDEVFTPSVLAALKKEIDAAEFYRAEHPNEFSGATYTKDYLLQERGIDKTLFEDKADISALLAAVVTSVNVGDRTILANFYFTGAIEGTSVLLAYDLLTPALQTRFTSLYY